MKPDRAYRTTAIPAQGIQDQGHAGRRGRAAGARPHQRHQRQRRQPDGAASGAGRADGAGALRHAGRRRGRPREHARQDAVLHPQQRRIQGRPAVPEPGAGRHDGAVALPALDTPGSKNEAASALWASPLFFMCPPSGLFAIRDSGRAGRSELPPTSWKIS